MKARLENVLVQMPQITSLTQSFVEIPKIWIVNCLRPYHVENTSSRPITEVKQH